MSRLLEKFDEVLRCFGRALDRATLFMCAVGLAKRSLGWRRCVLLKARFALPIRSCGSICIPSRELRSDNGWPNIAWRLRRWIFRMGCRVTLLGCALQAR